MKIELVKTLPKKIDNFNNALARFSITLAPIFIGNERNGIMEYLNNFDQRYIPELKGVLVSYSNIQLEESVARIMYDSPFLHFNILVEVTLFSPKLGTLISGVVNKVSPDHIGLLIDEKFNASIPSTEIRSGYEWSSALMHWQKGEKVIDSGKDVKFIITKLLTHNGMLTLSGSMKHLKERKDSTA